MRRQRKKANIAHVTIRIDTLPLVGTNKSLSVFEASPTLPTAAEAELPPDTVKSVNGAGLKVLELDKAKMGKNRSYITTFTQED